MSRFYPVSYGAGVLLLPVFAPPRHDERIVRPSHRKESRHARV